MHRNLCRARAVGLLLAVLVAASACSTDNQPVAEAPMTTVGGMAEAPAARRVGPDEFERRIAEPGVVTVNVHVPDEGDIPGTDLSISYEHIVHDVELPTDKATPLAIYCRSDSMSADAVEDLRAAGYTDVVELDGGFNAWKASGRPLE